MRQPMKLDVHLLCPGLHALYDYLLRTPLPEEHVRLLSELDGN